jgi:hypothetical protein
MMVKIHHLVATKAAKSCQMLPKAAKSCQKAAKSSQKLPKPAKTCQNLPEPPEIYLTTKSSKWLTCKLDIFCCQIYRHILADFLVVK